MPIIFYKSLVEDKRPHICQSFTKKQLVELCRKRENEVFDQRKRKDPEFWKICRATCNEIMGGKVDYSGRLKSLCATTTNRIYCKTSREK